MEMNRIEEMVAENVTADIEIPEKPSVQLDVPGNTEEIVSELNEVF